MKYLDFVKLQSESAHRHKLL